MGLMGTPTTPLKSWCWRRNLLVVSSADTASPYTNLEVEFNTAVQDEHLQNLFFTRLTTPRTVEMANFTCTALNGGGNCMIRFATAMLVITRWKLRFGAST
jgi:hypothetical protein